MGILKKIISAVQNRTTYRLGLIQSKAYRILKQQTAQVLLPLGISPIEWALMGLIHDQTSLRPKEAAGELGVEAPYVTTMIQNLETKKLISMEKDQNDSRAKVITLTTHGHTFMQKTEEIVRNGMRGSVRGATANELMGYVRVLETIIKNEEGV